MMKMMYVLAVGMLVLGGCVVYDTGHVKKAPPGQVQKTTGYNPASGKMKR